MEEQLVNLVSKQIDDASQHQIGAVLDLLDQGNTIPFIARYRKEVTGSLDEVQILSIQNEYKRVTALQDRKQAVLNSIAEQGKMTKQLSTQINQAEKIQDVEDLYLPYKQKRQTKAMIAKKHGLMPLANWIMSFKQGDLATQAKQYVDADKSLPAIGDVFDGAHEILAETFSEVANIRNWVRNYTMQHAKMVTSVKKSGKSIDEMGVYQQYYEFEERLVNLSSYQVLAINRGEKEKVLSVKFDVDESPVENYLHFRLIGHRPESESSQFIEEAYEDSYKRFIGPAIERELRHTLTEQAQEQAIGVFGENLYHLLMQAPMKGKIVLGFDPAYRTGCKLAVIDQNGKFLTKDVIYPHKPAPQSKRDAAEGQLIDLIEKYGVEMIAIGNGTASRESEQFVSTALGKINRPVYYVIVNEAGASVYSASQEARDEFPDLHVEQRSAISIGRRLQDPLAELVKINPESVGVGQYQHDLPNKDLDNELDAVVERAVNQVGVNLNTASYQLLTHISGLSKTIALNIVHYRDENGRYDSRAQLKKVPRLGPKAYEQSVGFLRIIDGKNPLDNTDVHPESYSAAKKILELAGVSVAQIGDTQQNQKINQLNDQQLIDETGLGAETVKDIKASLQAPGRDLRDDMPTPLLRKDVLTIEDLKTGMKLQGTVRNVVDFGAFVDVGVKHDGLVHVSKLSRKFTRDPRKIVAVGDIVDVWVDSVDVDRQRVQLTMIEPKDQPVA
ncbi:Tex family protein [Paucilactobacillus suebicus]|uniref:Transcriptional accessory protein n=1 Tax=Paucilactobacillus suebicus DSM 5007 = KCTC 3549 TaxID=1423807 RepID=A0A0R1W235_9LACO|nr:Tex family protein [Paucilactobacillus suebicus]KRM11661.1 transcriptional accessory protein [Paucilactobacillus suebicus DSM 5007 = KCTC 3549]